MYDSWVETENALKAAVQRPEAIAAFHDLPPDLAPRLRSFESPIAVVTFLRWWQQSVTDREAIFRELVPLARSGGKRGRLMQAILMLSYWPALSKLLRCARLATRDAIDEATAALLDLFILATSRVNLAATNHLAATLALNTGRLFRRWLRTRRRTAIAELSTGKRIDNFRAEERSFEVFEMCSDLERHADERDGEVIESVLDGFVKTARRCQSNPETLRKRAQRAFARLRGRLGEDIDRLRVPVFSGHVLSAVVEEPRMEVADVEYRSPNQGQEHPVQDRQPRRSRVAARTRSHSSLRNGAADRARLLDSHHAQRIHERRLAALHRGSEADRDAADAAGGDAMKTDEIRSLVVIIGEGGRDGGDVKTTVRYCDQCRRWGESGSVHVCGTNWHEHLETLLVELSRRGR